MSALQSCSKGQNAIKLAESFGVAAQDAHRFGQWRKGLGFAKEGFAFAAGAGVMIGTGGAIVPALAAAAATSVAGRFAINKLLPRVFSRTQPAPSTPEA